ncbi:hypothetical protein PENTCL1PPCAC_12983, partial [Pristionchus entomophagus]
TLSSCSLLVTSSMSASAFLLSSGIDRGSAKLARISPDLLVAIDPRVHLRLLRGEFDLQFVDFIETGLNISHRQHYVIVLLLHFLSLNPHCSSARRRKDTRITKLIDSLDGLLHPRCIRVQRSTELLDVCDCCMRSTEIEGEMSRVDHVFDAVEVGAKIVDLHQQMDRISNGLSNLRVLHLFNPFLDASLYRISHTKDTRR